MGVTDAVEDAVEDAVKDAGATVEVPIHWFKEESHDNPFEQHASPMQVPKFKLEMLEDQGSVAVVEVVVGAADGLKYHTYSW